MIKLLVLPFVIFSAAVGSDIVRQVDYQTGSLTPLNISPTFDNGYLVVYGHRGASVYSNDGSIAYAISNPENGRIANLAVDKDRTAAAAVHYGLPSGRAGAISVFNSTGSQISLIRTGRYLPSFVCFGPDHSIWAIGRQVRESLDDRPEFFVMRHFSPDGKVLGAFLPRSSFDREGEPSVDIIGMSGLRTADNRIGAWLDYGGERGKALWVETDLNGNETGRWRLDGRTPKAFLSRGVLYAQKDGGFSVLDRPTGKWIPILLPFDGILLGSDGQALVFLVRGGTRLHWINP